jgi:disulfide bond formation protein DsbB
MSKSAKICYVLAWLISLAGLVGSLVFSEVMVIPPCVLCWWQRIALYPLVVVIGIGILRRDTKLHLYVLPFSIIGVVVAFYHSLLQWGIISESTQVCGVDSVSCAIASVNYFGFITIPFMSLVAFLGITGLMLLTKLRQK